MFKYSYDALVYYGEVVKTSIERVAKFGYDAIELVGEPDDYKASEVKQLCEDNGIKVSSMCSIFTGDKRDISSPNPKNRKSAVDYVRKVADFAATVGATVMIVAPNPVGNFSAWKDPEEEWRWAVDGIREGAVYAQNVGVKLAIEAWNRYETYFLNRIDQCLKLMKDVGMPNVGVMGDTFHMNIEDESISGAFRAAGSNLLHVHLADSNRAAPGKGHIDFKPVLQALKDINYGGYLTFELLPAAADPFGTMKKGGGREFFDEYTKSAIETIKAIEKQLK